MRKTLAALAVAGFIIPSTASAHVDVLPERLVEGQATQFTVRVPTERPGLQTTVVRVEFPEKITVYSFQPPPPGWTMTVQRAANGRVSGVEYRGSLGQERYQDFAFMGNTFTTGKGYWKSFQTYSDGKVKPWTLDPFTDDTAEETGPTDPGPGSPYKVVAATDAGATAEGADAGGASPGGSSSGGAPTWLAALGVGVGGVALLVAGMLWTTRPVQLPDDE